MLDLTTTRRLALTALLFFAWVPAAHAWTWPVQGPVLQPFAYDEAHPYAAGQHRGIDIGGGATGEKVVAPAAGAVSFAGSVPSSGESLTIETPDSYSVTLTHLGSIAVSKGASVVEGETVGTIGPSGTPEVAGPYLHLGIRVTSDANGYLDPLELLPPPSPSGPAQSDPPVSQPSADGGAATAPTAAPAPEPTTSTSAPSAPTSEATVGTTRSSGRSSRGQRPVDRSRSSGRATREVTRPRSSQRLVPKAMPARLPVTQSHRRIDLPMGSSGRPVVEPAPAARLRLDAGHELAAPGQRSQPEESSPLLPLACNGAAALVALAAAFAAGRSGRRRRAGDTPSAQILRLPRAVADGAPARRAA